MVQQDLGLGRITQGLLTALAQDEAALEQADQEFQDARARYEVAASRYAAMRDAVRQRLGVSPYNKRVAWPLDLSSLNDPFPESPGKYRFLRMPVGSALVEVLAEADQPLTLEEIAKALTAGGMYFKDARSVNAALINTKGVLKSEDGRYVFEKKPESEDDLPW